jgi:hypothetical protein
MVRQNADIPLMFCGRLDGKQFDKHLILRTKHQPLNQRVHGSSPCAPTIEIKCLGGKHEPWNKPNPALANGLANETALARTHRANLAAGAHWARGGETRGGADAGPRPLANQRRKVLSEM